MTTAIHNFKDSLAKSEQTASAPWWKDLYEEFFGPEFVEAVQMPENTLGQRLGIDRTVILSTGRVLRVDEKLRSGSYSDILLEFDSGHGPGWACKPTMADHLLYVTPSLRHAVLLEVDALHRAWRHHGEKWKGLYGVKASENATYRSLNVGVPLHELLSAMRQCSEVRGIDCGDSDNG